MVVHCATCKTVLVGTVASIVSELAAREALLLCSSFGLFLGTVVRFAVDGSHVELLEIAHIALDVFIVVVGEVDGLVA